MSVGSLLSGLVDLAATQGNHAKRHRRLSPITTDLSTVWSPEPLQIVDMTLSARSNCSSIHRHCSINFNSICASSFFEGRQFTIIDQFTSPFVLVLELPSLNTQGTHLYPLRSSSFCPSDSTVATIILVIQLKKTATGISKRYPERGTRIAGG